MLRNDVMVWVLIIWIMCTCIVALDVYARIEAENVKKQITPVVEETVTKPVELVSCATEEKIEATLEITAMNTKTYFDVNLSEDLQDHIFEECKKYDIDPAIVVAMIAKESVYNPDAIGDGGNSLGLMQIQPRWHRERMKKLGTTNLFNPYQNVTVGIDLLAELFATGKSTEWVLMAYNGGRSYANEKLALGIVSDYANTVMTNARLLNTYEVVEEV